ncbi:fibronectin type III domain-containing protein, partial [bacterium]|nr:fibronectin type III domain-containing protein [bacterium]
MFGFPLRRFAFALPIIGVSVLFEPATADEFCPPKDRPCPIGNTPDFDKPVAPPNGLRVTPLAGRSMRVQWRDTTPNETNFIVTRSSTSATRSVGSTTSSGKGQAYQTSFARLPAGRHCFQVTARNSFGLGRPSIRACASTLAPQNDQDRDGISDLIETTLLRRFAPLVWLHSTETRLPANVDFLLENSRLRFSHPRCSDHELLAWGTVTRTNIAQQSHRNVNVLCRHTDPVRRSNNYTGAPKRSFFLQF